MPLNISGLVNNISGSFSNAVDQFLGKSKDISPYPTGRFAKDIQNRIIPENWNHLAFPYSFDVIDIEGKGTIFSEFQLPLAPTALNQDELTSVKITHTQGGTVSTHSGMKYKDLIIEGTTGVAPFRGSGGVDKKTGQGILQPADMKYRSGYEVFQHLRNYFKTYYAWKKSSGTRATNERLIFKNYKDGEFLIVELIKFGMVRQAARPFLYDYKMEFKVLSHFKFETPEQDFLERLDSAFNNAVNKIDLARGTFLRVQGILRQIEGTYEAAVLEPLRKISLAVKALKNIPVVAGDIGNRIIKNTVNEVNALAITTGLKDQQKQNSISGGVDQRIVDAQLPTDLESAVSNQKADIVAGLGEPLMAMSIDSFPEKTQTELDKEIAEIIKLPRSFYTDTIADLERIQANAEDAFNLSASTLDSLFNRTATLEAESIKEVTDDEFLLLGAFNDALAGIDILISHDTLFKSTFNQRIQDTIDSFEGQIALQSLPAVRQYTVSVGDTLERIAQRELGNTDRWVEIVEINNLVAPYLTDDITSTENGVRKPGETILIPEVAQEGFSNLPNGKEHPLTANLSELEKSFGVDLKLTKDYDLSLSNTNDLETIASTDNLAQSVLLKLFYEKGELVHAPEIGVGLIVGSKISNLDDIKDAVVQTLLQDPRVDSITDLAIIRDNSEIKLAFNLKAKSVDVPVPVKIRL